MGKMANIEYAKLDNLIAEHGKDFILKQVITRMADGDNPKDIARSFGVHYVYLKKWVEENAADDVALAKRAHSDVLIASALEAVDNAQIEDVAVARLKADTYMKVAGKQDRSAWGDKVDVSVGYTINIVDILKEARGRVIEHSVPLVISDCEVLAGEDVI